MIIDKAPGSSMLDYELHSLEEILGTEGSRDFQSRLPLCPEDLLTRGILHRAGRAGFYYWMKNTSDKLNWNNPEIRFSPIKKKITLGLQLICEMINAEKGELLLFENQPDHWEILTLPVADNDISSPMLNCNYLSGFVQEFTSWAGMGKFYRVTTSHVQQDSGVSCRIFIEKKPIDF